MTARRNSLCLSILLLHNKGKVRLILNYFLAFFFSCEPSALKEELFAKSWPGGFFDGKLSAFWLLILIGAFIGPDDDAFDAS